jgi:hypothetical protein
LSQHRNLISRNLLKMSTDANENTNPVNNETHNNDGVGETKPAAAAGDATNCAKRAALVDLDEEENSKRMKVEVYDLAETMGFKAGDRLEVEWEIVDASSTPGTHEADDALARTRWWGATLMEHDGRTEDSVAIRTLDYDPYVEGGFPDHSKEDVIFLGRDLLVDPVTQTELQFRRQGAEEEDTVYVGREDIESIVNATLAQALQRNQSSWNAMEPSKQAFIASMIAEKKEKLTELLSSHADANGVVTADDMRTILTQTMEL